MPIKLPNVTLAAVTLCDKVIDVIRAERAKDNCQERNILVSSLIAL